MAKVITFSRAFPKGHPKAGEPTLFVEQVLNALQYDYHSGEYLELLNKLNDPKKVDIIGFFFSLGFFKDTTNEKLHTIRSGNRWKQGDKASLRVWSGKPYNSPQIIIAPEVTLVSIYDFEIDQNPFPIGPEVYHGVNGLHLELDEIAQNDGLSVKDFKSWFNYPKPFEGQILAWKEVGYV